MPSIRTATLILIALITLPALSFGQKKDTGPIVVDPNQVPADYWIQGEYAGVIEESPNGASKNVGLQVISLGKGAFEAVILEGGLPGDGWDKKSKTRLAGIMLDNTAKFESDAMNIAVGDFKAEFSDSNGTLLGTLPRYKRQSPTLNLPAPADAVVLFDGSNADQWKNGKISTDGLLMENTETVEAFEDFRLHIEFRLPYKPEGRGQDRGNSGLYIHSRYEVQVLDSFGLDLQFNDCASLYRFKAPDFNMSLPPLTWQTYDIWFKAAKFDADGNKTENVRITVMHNGVKVHDNLELPRKTGAGKPESPQLLPTKLQGHSNPVRFRNIWLVKGVQAPPSGSYMQASSQSTVPTAPGANTTTNATTSSPTRSTTHTHVAHQPAGHDVHSSSCGCGSHGSFGYHGYSSGCASGHCASGYCGGATHLGPLWSRNSTGIYGGLWPDFTYDNSHQWYVYP